MLYGIVDIGSNTVRVNIYDIIDDNAEFLFSKKYALGLVSYIKKGKLTDKGKIKLLDVINDIKNDLTRLNVKKYNMFATASLRNISNSKKILKTVKDQLDVAIEILSDDEEAYYSFIGSVSVMNKKKGVLIDVGGGSSEVVIYNDKKVEYSYSLPIGSLTLFNEYVELLVPTKKECNAIRDRVRFEINKLDIPKKHLKYMCGVGGSVRAVLKLSKDLGIIERKGRVISPKIFKTLLKELSKNDKETYSKLLQAKPSRVHTMIPGLLIIQCLCDYFSIEELQVSKFGVREGFLNHMLEIKNE